MKLNSKAIFSYTFSIMLLMLLMSFSAFAAGEQVVNEPAGTFDAENSYYIDAKSDVSTPVTQISAISGVSRPMDIRYYLPSHMKTAYIQISIDSTDKLKSADKVELKLYGYLSAGGCYSLYEVANWGNTTDAASWSVGESLGQSTPATTGEKYTAIFDVTNYISTLSDDDNFIRFAVREPNTVNNGDLYAGSSNVPTLTAQYSTTPAKFLSVASTSYDAPVSDAVSVSDTEVTPAVGTALLGPVTATSTSPAYVELAITDLSAMQQSNQIMLTMGFWQLKGSRVCKLYKVTNYGDGTTPSSYSYGEIISETTITNTGENAAGWTSFDVTKYIKSLPVETSTAQFAVIYSGDNGLYTKGNYIPKFEAINETGITGLSGLIEGEILKVTKGLAVGTETTPLTATPIIAIYGSDKNLKIAQIGETLIGLDGTKYTEVTAEISGYTPVDGDYAKLFVWNSLENLTPLTGAEDLHYSAE
ncbi:MAG: hypothetical protein GX154_11145 [Clostridiales bacterium]|nr:hypothetical protein [Clostridiales bacterium]